MEVFGRDPGYDTSQDPVVRYTAGDIRKRLAQYYQNPGHEREICIQLPPGSYVLEFQQPPEAPPNPVPPVDGKTKSRRLGMAAVGAAAVLVAALLGWWWRPWAGNSVVDRFWEPFRSDPGAVLFSIGEPKVFTVPENLNTDFISRAEPYYKAGVPVPNSILPPSGLLPIWDRYTLLGDAACMTRLAVLLQQFGKAYRIRGSPATSLADLREGPDILIGAFTNQWSLRMTEDLRFGFGADNDGGSGIRDRMHPEKDEWKFGKDFWPDPKSWTDYGLITRIRHSPTGRITLIAAGLHRHATSAAGEILASASYLDEALRLAPRGWEGKSIQIVFATSVMEGNAGPPRILAVHTW